MENSDDIFLKGAGDARVDDFDDLLEYPWYFWVVPKYAHDDTDKRIQSFWILYPVEQSLAKIISTLQTKLMTSLTPMLFLLRLSINFSKYWSIRILSL